MAEFDAISKFLKGRTKAEQQLISDSMTPEQVVALIVDRGSFDAEQWLRTWLCSTAQEQKEIILQTFRDPK